MDSHQRLSPDTVGLYTDNGPGIAGPTIEIGLEEEDGKNLWPPVEADFARQMWLVIRRNGAHTIDCGCFLTLTGALEAAKLLAEQNAYQYAICEVVEVVRARTP